MTITRRRWEIALALVPALLCLAGCQDGGHFSLLGYTTQPTFDTSIRTVYVPIAENITYKRGIEFDLTRAVVRELGLSPYRVVSDRSKADTELVMKVMVNRKTLLLQNQLGETRDADIWLVVSVIWKDLRPGRGGDILSNPKRFDATEAPLPGFPVATAPSAVPILITPNANYVPELGGSNTSAEQRAINQAARQVVNMMEVWR